MQYFDNIRLKAGHYLYGLSSDSAETGPFPEIYYENLVDAMLSIFHPSTQKFLAENSIIPRNETETAQINYNVFINTFFVTEDVEVSMADFRAVQPGYSFQAQQAILNDESRQVIMAAMHEDCRETELDVFRVYVPVIFDGVNQLRGLVFCQSGLLVNFKSQWLNLQLFVEDARSWHKSNAPILEFQMMLQDESNKYLQTVAPRIIQSTDIYTVQKPIPDYRVSIADDPYLRFPSDVLRKIGLEMDIESIDAACQYSERFNRALCTNDSFWQEKVRRDHGPTIERLNVDRGILVMSWKTYYLQLHENKNLIGMISSGMTTFQMLEALLFLVSFEVIDLAGREPTMLYSWDRFQRFMRSVGISGSQYGGVVRRVDENGRVLFTRHMRTLTDSAIGMNFPDFSKRDMAMRTTTRISESILMHRIKILTELRLVVGQLRNRAVRRILLDVPVVNRFLNITLYGDDKHDIRVLIEKLKPIKFDGGAQVYDFKSCQLIKTALIRKFDLTDPQTEVNHFSY